MHKKLGLEGQSLIILNILASYAVKSYFKLYFDIKVKHKMEDAPHSHSAENSENGTKRNE